MFVNPVNTGYNWKNPAGLDPVLSLKMHYRYFKPPNTIHSGLCEFFVFLVAL